MIKILNASFLTSASKLNECLSEGIPEVAFLGRSNVGKSSLINALTNHKNLAKKSSTPGKTRLINFFKIIFSNEDRSIAHFVDLPGFGYAKVSKKEQDIWKKDLNEFIQKRFSIRIFLLLIDSRHYELKIDNEVFEYLQNIKKGDQKIVKVFTKIDKLNQKELNALKRANPNAIMVSTLKKQGINELNDHIFNILFTLKDEV